jgi:hypothetical protein
MYSNTYYSMDSFTFLMQVTTKLIRDKLNKCSSVKTKAAKKVRRYERSLKQAQFRAMIDYRLLLANPALYKQEKTSRQVRLFTKLERFSKICIIIEHFPPINSRFTGAFKIGKLSISFK